jgi:hypothetical protein
MSQVMWNQDGRRERQCLATMEPHPHDGAVGPFAPDPIEHRTSAFKDQPDRAVG